MKNKILNYSIVKKISYTLMEHMRSCFLADYKIHVMQCKDSAVLWNLLSKFTYICYKTNLWIVFSSWNLISEFFQLNLFQSNVKYNSFKKVTKLKRSKNNLITSKKSSDKRNFSAKEIETLIIVPFQESLSSLNS